MPRRRISHSGVTPTIQQQQTTTVENNFVGGLKTEFTGLNFPENACTAADNTVFTITGECERREGINYEANNVLNPIMAAEASISTYRWKNAGGDGQTEVLVSQVGTTLYFFTSSASSITNPLSSQILISTVSVASFVVPGNTTNVGNIECQFSDGNGFLFVYHPDCDPFYCTFTAGTITGNRIQLQVRDFTGIAEPSVAANTRPITLTAEHNYNLANQGWSTGASATTTLSYSGQLLFPASGAGGNTTFTNVPTGLAFTPGEKVSISGLGTYNGSFGNFGGGGIVTSYSGTTLVINVLPGWTGTPGQWFVYLITISTINTSLITTWFNAIGNYPSNSDQWWAFKDDTDTFAPTTTEPNVTLNAGQAPQGYFIFSPFGQQRSTISGIAGLTDVITMARPKTGTWFQGRVWYAGVDASQAATGDAAFYTWTENIYFSQIVQGVGDFGNCYQENDPTSEDLFDLLPSDGGVIQIQGCGSIYRLFPIQNGMLVFASNGIWFITGSSGIGFAANDYTITKISSVQTLSGHSFVDVNGLPMFWNEEGIYAVEPSQGTGYGLAVNPLTVGTILSFYNSIPVSSKKHARGAYNPITYIVQWIYRSTVESDTTSRFQFDSALSLNIYNKAFYPYSFAIDSINYVSGLFYMNYPSGAVTASTQPEPQFKYLTVVNQANLTFSEENDGTNWVDWFSYNSVGTNYNSTFTAGYKLHGAALRRFQPMYVQIYSNNAEENGYVVNSVWDFATSSSSGKTSAAQVITNNTSNFGVVYRRHKLRGHGMAFQLQVSSQNGLPFNIIGWSTYETINASV